MPLSFVFWLLMLLWLIFGIMGMYPFPADRRGWALSAGGFLLWIILFVLGWAVFGFIIKAG